MRSTPLRIHALILSALLTLLTGRGVALAAAVPDRFRPITETAEPFVGVTHYRVVQPFDEPKIALPRPLVIHLVEVDPDAPGVSFVATPDNDEAPGPFTRRTVTDFAEAAGVAVAVNANFFTRDDPSGAAYPERGSDAIGLAMAHGVLIARPHPRLDDSLVLLEGDRVEIIEGDDVPGDAVHAVSGNQRLVRNGEVDTPDDRFTRTPNPRTAVGIDRDTGRVWLAVVDGRQADYSEGLRTDELARVLIAFGVEDAINLDGGGSSALVFADRPDGGLRTVNSPSDAATPRAPGRERGVANHLGVHARPNPDYTRIPNAARPPHRNVDLDWPQSGHARYSEADADDLSDANREPTPVGLEPGVNSIIARVGGSDVRDVFTFDVPEGHRLVSIRLIAYDSEPDASTPLQAAFGPVFPPDGLPDIGQSTLQDAAENSEVLPRADAFTYGPGTYTFRTTEFGPPAVYRLDLVLAAD